MSPQGDPCPHGVILKVVASAICGSDLHMSVPSAYTEQRTLGLLSLPPLPPTHRTSIFFEYRRYRYRTSAGDGMGQHRSPHYSTHSYHSSSLPHHPSPLSVPLSSVFGHEITGLVVERGPNVEIVQLGDIVSVPFNLACGLCASCVRGKTQLCLRLNPNPLVAGAIPGYADMGGWKGGQAEFVMIPYADFNLLVLPRDPLVLAEHILEFGMLADVLPTGCNAAVQAGVGLGQTVYIAGCGPIGLCAAATSFALGASKVIVGGYQP